MSELYAVEVLEVKARFATACLQTQADRHGGGRRRLMGFSWAMVGHVEVPRDKHEAYRAALADPTRYHDWTDEFGVIEDGEEPLGMTVDKVIAAYDDADAKAIAWNGDRLELRAVFSNDTDCWLGYRHDLAAAIRTAADFGGTGELAITGWLDGGPDDVYRVTSRPDGSSRFEVLTARRADAVRERVFAEVEPVVEAMLAAHCATRAAKAGAAKPRGVAVRVQRAAEVAKAPRPAATPPAATVAFTTAKQAAAAVAALRKQLPKQPNVSLHYNLTLAPAVTELRDSGSSLVRDAVRARLDALTKGSKLARLKTADQVYAFALTLVLEKLAVSDDLDVLFRLWTAAPGFMLMYPEGVARHGEAGARFLAKLYGKRAANEYANQIQPHAARALLATDEPAAAGSSQRSHC